MLVADHLHSTALGLCQHVKRRAPYLPLFSPTFHTVSPCYAYRYKINGESDEDYVLRLADELEAKFQELGPSTVGAFFAETSKQASGAPIRTGSLRLFFQLSEQLPAAHRPSRGTSLP